MALSPPGAGELRHRIRVERDVATRDAKGNTSTSTQIVATGISAKITPTRGGEEVRASRLQGIENYEIVVRISDKTRAIKPSDRLVDERTGTTFQVKWKADLLDSTAFLWIAAQAGGLA